MKTIFVIILFALQSFLIFSQDVSKDKIPLKYSVSIAGMTEGVISKEELLNAKSLVINKEDATVFHVASFKMTLICKGKDVVELENNKNSELTERMIQEIKNADTGCKLFFEFIKIADNKDPYKPYKSSHPLNFVIK